VSSNLAMPDLARAASVSPWLVAQTVIERGERVVEQEVAHSGSVPGNQWEPVRCLAGTPAPSLLLAFESWGMTRNERISRDPSVCHGKPCIRGTRIMVSVVLDNLAAGLSPHEIVAEYPPLTADDVQAAMAYAADLAREEELIPLR
jgi:uncharacterized protein (DUF433 family)